MLSDMPQVPPDPEQEAGTGRRLAALREQLRALQEALDAVRREVKVALHELESMRREKKMMLHDLRNITGHGAL